MADPIILPPLPEPDISVPFLSEVRKVPQGDYYRADKVLPLLKQWPVLYEAAKAGHEQAFAEAQNAADEIERLRAEVAGLRAELLKSLADNAALRDERDNMAGAIAQLLRDNRDVHEKVVRPLRERVRVLEDALTRLRQWGDMGAGYSAIVLVEVRDWIDAGMTGDLPEMPEWAVDRKAAVAARKGEAC